MTDRSVFLRPVIGLFILAAVTSCTASPMPAEWFVKESRNADSIPRYEILEMSFMHNGTYKNNFFDVSLQATFTSHSGSKWSIKGFYYGGEVWKIRFRPDEPGRWNYTYTMTGKDGFHKEGGGTFDCSPSDAEGPVRGHPKNPYRWIFSNGKPYFPVGLQDCIQGKGGQLNDRAIDGEKREDRARQVSPEEYFAIYGQAGFNLFRFSQDNCSYPLYDNLDHYREAECLVTDELLLLARKHGLRVMFGFFGFHGNRSGENRPVGFLRRIVQKVLGSQEEAIINHGNDKIVAKERRFIDYCVARWGVYVDFWELLNERKASDEWTALMADYVRSIDPDRRPISTSWEKPHLSAIDINAPHWYESESEFKSDLRVQEQAAQWKKAGKPVIVGEQGNTGMNWDPLSGLRMRIRTWTALFQEISFIFWNTIWSKAGMFEGRYTPGEAANIYLGPEERGYIRVLQDFSSRLDAAVRMTPVETTSPDRIRAYGLLSHTVAAVYLHHFIDHSTPIRGLKITLDLPEPHLTAKLVADWINPSNGEVLLRTRVLPGRQTLDVPPFNIDLALRVSSLRS